MTTATPGPAPIENECPESKMDDGSHATDYEDSGSCPWCGKRNPDYRPPARGGHRVLGRDEWL